MIILKSVTKRWKNDSDNTQKSLTSWDAQKFVLAAILFTKSKTKNYFLFWSFWLNISMFDTHDTKCSKHTDTQTILSWFRSGFTRLKFDNVEFTPTIRRRTSYSDKRFWPPKLKFLRFKFQTSKQLFQFWNPRTPSYRSHHHRRELKCWPVIFFFVNG